jgi:hypothetical protein
VAIAAELIGATFGADESSDPTETRDTSG